MSTQQSKFSGYFMFKIKISVGPVVTKMSVFKFNRLLNIYHYSTSLNYKMRGVMYSFEFIHINTIL